MSSKKRNTRQQKGRGQQQPPVKDPRKQGMRAFSANSFDAAIAAWSQLDQGDAAVQRALAEAYFRRALTQSEDTQRVADMQEAHRRQPDEPRYQYHLALALHRTGDTAGASKMYRAVLAEHPRWSGAGMVLALAELARDPAVDIASLPGSTAAVQATLHPVQTLLQGKQPDAPDDANDPVQQLWYGLGMLERDPDEARNLLSEGHALPTVQADTLRMLYHGKAAAQAGDTDTALHDWQQVYEANTLRIDWLPDSLAALLGERLRAALDADDVERVGALITWCEGATFRHSALNPLLVQAMDRLARAEAGRGNWQQAALRWEHARQVVSDSSSLGSPRVLLHNLALAYETLEEWQAAAEMWRAMLRTRPRKSKSEADKAADPMDYTDEQWAWIRKRVVTCYQYAGEPGEAVKIFRQALKSTPDDLEMRVQLADALLANDQMQASINELERILQRDSKHVEAHLRMANIYIQLSDGFDWRGYEAAAERSLRVVFDQEPQREDVRRQIARLMLSRGQKMHSRANMLRHDGLLESARRLFEEGQQFAPDDYQFPLNLARVLLDEGKTEQARPHLERVMELGSDNPKAFVQVIDFWAVSDNIDEARAVLERARHDTTVSIDFYLELFATLVLRSMPAPAYDNIFGFSLMPSQPAQGPWLDFAMEVAQLAQSLMPGDPQVPLQLAAVLMKLQQTELALEQAEIGVQMAPDDPGGMILLGILQGASDRKREAKKTLSDAAKLARKQGRTDIAERAEMVRQEVSSPMFSLSGLFDYMYGFDDGLDDDFDDDDDFFF